MVGRIYGTTSCGSHGSGEDFFLANDSKASIDNRSVDGRIGLAVSEKKDF